MGGEKSFDQACTGVVEGSPPHGRGKVVRSGVHRCCRGITPAWAGKSHQILVLQVVQRNHPRAGGEKHQIDFRGTVGLGSSPHRRGKAHLWIIHQIFIRITPAWAGKRSVELFLSVLSLDHPRVGGEKTVKVPALVVPTGSPLRGRGKVVLHCGVLLDVGITPAWAGKRQRPSTGRSWQGDHPRVGGEKFALECVLPALPGSPPRGRGKGYLVKVPFVIPGITPAWAGKSYACCPVLSLS